MNLIGGCGPLISAYIITVVRSRAKFRIVSKPIFFLVFLCLWIVGLLLLNFKGNQSGGMGSIPHLSQVSPLGFILLNIPFFILSINASNATNKNLNENYISSFLFDKKKVKWYVLAILILIVLKLLSYFIGDFIGFKTTDFILKPKWIWLLGLLSVFLIYGGPEEFGWRGFLQKELQKKYNPLISALIISFFWSLWHLPLYYNGYTQLMVLW